VNTHSFETMPIEELWALHSEIAKLLTAKITSEKLELERRSARLQASGLAGAQGSKAERRPIAAGITQVPKSPRAGRDVVRPGQTTQVGYGAIEAWQET
jgi:hypothetical protein